MIAIIDAVPGWSATAFQRELRLLVTPDVADYLKPNAPEAVFVHAGLYNQTTTHAAFRILAGYQFPVPFVRSAIDAFLKGRDDLPSYLSTALKLLYENEFASISRSNLRAQGTTYVIQAIDKLIRNPLWNWVEFYSGLILAGVQDVWRPDFAFMDILNNRANRPQIDVDRDVVLYLFSSLRVMNVKGGQITSACVFVLNRHAAQNTEDGKQFTICVGAVYSEMEKLVPIATPPGTASDKSPPTIQWPGRGGR